MVIEAKGDTFDVRAEASMNLDPSASNEPSMDLVRLWPDARTSASLERMSIELEGLEERMVGKVPVPGYLLETFTFDLGKDRSEKLYIGRINDQLPTMFYRSKPKIGG